MFKQHKKVVKGQTQDLKEVKPFSQDLKVGVVKSEKSGHMEMAVMLHRTAESRLLVYRVVILTRNVTDECIFKKKYSDFKSYISMCQTPSSTMNSTSYSMIVNERIMLSDGLCN